MSALLFFNCHRNMNILFLYHSPILPHLGGLERVTSLLAHELKKKGCVIFFLIITNSTDEKPLTDFPSFYIETGSKSNKVQFEKIILENNIDVIINQSSHPSTIKFLEGINLTKVKVFSVLHMQPFPSYKKERLMKLLDRPDNFKSKLIKYIAVLSPFLYRKAIIAYEKKIIKGLMGVSDKIIVLSEKFIQRMVRFIPDIDQSKFYVIPNPNTFSYTQNLNSDKKENLILFVGRLFNPQKNISGYLKVWRTFQVNHPDWETMIIGDGPHRRHLEIEAEKSGCRNYEFKGNVKDIKEFYSKAKILALTSIYEGWGMTITEAMACECVPVVFSSYESAEDIITNKVSGILVPPFQYEIMGEELNRLASDPTLLSTMAAAGKNEIAKYDASLMADKWIELFYLR